MIIHTLHEERTKWQYQGTVITLKGTVITLKRTVITLKRTVITLKGTVITLQGTVITLQGTVITLQGIVITLNGTIKLISYSVRNHIHMWLICSYQGAMTANKLKKISIKLFCLHWIDKPVKILQSSSAAQDNLFIML